MDAISDFRTPEAFNDEKGDWFRVVYFPAAAKQQRESLGQLRLSRVICAVVVFSAAAVIAAPAQTVKTLVSFDGTNGSYPYLMTLVQGTDGNVYGTTSGGGANDAGTVFKITADGKLTTLHSFDNAEGAHPWAGLVEAQNRDFYGTTTTGGANFSGTVFKISPRGKVTTLYSFCSLPNCADGSYPTGTLVLASDGDFYGTTSDYLTFPPAGGTVFKITPTGKLTTLYMFCSVPYCAEGATPIGGLVQAAEGDFYGTTANGGNSTTCSDCGTLFKITTNGTLTTLHSFDGSDGSLPFAAPVQASDGDFYGTTLSDGANGSGTVFRITPAGKFTLLHSFCALRNCPDGFYPYAGLVQGTDGDFYGARSFRAALRVRTTRPPTSATGRRGLGRAEAERILNDQSSDETVIR